ncbi:MAG: hypothetical protein LKH59_04570 [Lactobacillus crispatus]|jgi:hypothetical protein|nr:hypothetical protein [Lactobacillus crispatus]MCI1335729.1 hypothetical protein [Lactobacillus crispatus]MCI1364850.1 hypothetical protein [Lactobacillus crispatus]MCI1493696.1 hypothetical protein [Lactobacillus crispatus]MCI1523727.1 hypothetical protein [Lactobacillus crispatus]
MIDLAAFHTIVFTTGEQTMTVTKYGIRFSKAAIVQLGKPEYVKIMINYEDKELVIKATSGSDTDKVSFLNPNKKKTEVQWNNSMLKNNLKQLMGWDLNNVSYKIGGKFIPEQNLMFFDLKKARVEKK